MVNLLTLKKLLVLFFVTVIAITIVIVIKLVNIESRVEKIEGAQKRIQTFELLQDKVSSKLDSMNRVTVSVTTNKPIKKFIDAIGHSESHNDYTTVSRNGHIGKYQFGPSTLVGVGICTNINDAKLFRDKFAKSPDSLRSKCWSDVEQDAAMVKLIKINKRNLYDYISTYCGKIFNGILITESGILAAAHLGGGGSIKRYFNSDMKLKNRGLIESYLVKFSGYDVSRI
jgi:hypothetical protein